MFHYSDLRSKAKRWDEKHVEGMKKKRNDCLLQLKDLAAQKRKRPQLDQLNSQIEGLRSRLKYFQREIESIVWNILFFVYVISSFVLHH